MGYPLSPVRKKHSHQYVTENLSRRDAGNGFHPFCCLLQCLAQFTNEQAISSIDNHPNRDSREILGSLGGSRVHAVTLPPHIFQVLDPTLFAIFKKKV
jgi:hypothetical protein